MQISHILTISLRNISSISQIFIRQLSGILQVYIRYFYKCHRMFPAYLRHISALTWKTRRLLNIDIFSVNPVWAGRGQICPPLHKFLNILFSIYKHMLRLVDFSCMSITVLLQKNQHPMCLGLILTAFFSTKSLVSKQRFFYCFQIMQKMAVFPKALRAIFSEVDSCALRF